MSNRLRKTVAALTASCALFAGSAQAVPFTWSDEFDPADVTVSSEYNYSHSIVGGDMGFRAGLDTVTSAFLSIVLTDDALFGDIPILGDGQERVSFNFDGTGWTTPQNVGLLDIFDFRFDTLLTDGMLGISLRATQGDFKFLRSDLVVVGNRSEVSEPVSIALFGLGMLGLAALRRSRVSK